MIALFFQECHRKGIIQYVTFRDSAECPWDSLKSLHVSIILPFVPLIPLDGCTTACLSIPLLWAFGLFPASDDYEWSFCQYLCVGFWVNIHFHFSRVIHPGEALLVTPCLTLPGCFFKGLYHSLFPPAVPEFQVAQYLCQNLIF